MKRYSLAMLLILITVLTFSCKKDNGKDEDSGLSQDIKNFVPQDVIDSMRQRGLIINEGKTPPNIAGIYNFAPNYCIFDNHAPSYEGLKFADYRYRFYNQDNDKLTISLDYKTLPNPIDSAAGVGSFIAGKDNVFTVFVNVSGVQDGIAYKQIGFYSGRVTSDGITDFQSAFYFTEKGPDPNHKLVEVGTSRIFEDRDEFSETNDTYRSRKITHGAAQ